MSDGQVNKYAAIDVGSNAVRLLISRVHKHTGKVKKVSIVRLPIRLGNDVFVDGEVSKKNIKRLCKAFEAYRNVMDIHEVDDFRACATSAMRNAANNTLIVDQIFKSSGINLEIIDGQEEAEIIMNSHLSEFVNDSGRYLHVDVGGGSTELNLFEEGELINSRSFPLGTVRMINGVEDKNLFKQIIRFLKENLDEGPIEALVGTGGNINKAHKLLGLPGKKPILKEDLLELYHELEVLSVDDRVEVFDLNYDRADVIVPALQIFLKVLDTTDTSSIYVPRKGLVDGIIYQLSEKELSR